MTRPLRIQYPGALYYITQHGNTGSAICKSDNDRQAFLSTLETSLQNYGAILHGFVLMKSHFHLLLETPGGNLSEVMRHMNISYTSYFNRMYRRKGHLYGGRYKSILIEKETFLTPVAHYLHLNPAMTGALKRYSKNDRLNSLFNWKWSSLPGYSGNSLRYDVVNHGDVLHHFGGDTPAGRSAYMSSIIEQLDNRMLLKEMVVGQSILGSTDFINQVNAMMEKKGSQREQPGRGAIDKYLKQEKVINELEKCFNCSRGQLLATPGDLRSITMDMLYRYGNLTNTAIGNLMGLDYSSVSLGRKQLRRKRKAHPKLDAVIALLEKRLQSDTG